MVWVKVDDDFPQHPKARKAGPVGMALWLAGLCYSSHYLTDGLVPVEVLSGLLPLEKKELTRTVDKLVFSGLWSVAEGGYEIHDYLDYQMSKQEVLMQRQIAQRRGAMNRDVNLTTAVRSRDGNQCRYCGITVNWKDRKSATGGTYDHVIPISKGGDESLANIVVACRGCNMSKGPRTPEEANLILLIPSSDLAEIKPGSSRNQTQNPDKTPTPIPSTKTKSPSGGRSASPPDPEMPSGFVGFYVDECKARGYEPVRQWRDQIGNQSKRIAAEKPPEIIRSAIRIMADERKAPGILAHVIADIEAGRNGNGQST